MSPVAVVVGSLALLLANFAISAGLLWLSCRLFRLRDVTYRRCLLALLVFQLVTLLCLPVAVSAGRLAGPEPLVANLVGLIVELLACLAGLAAMVWALRAPFGRSILSSITWAVLSTAYTVAFVFGLKALFFEAFVIPTGAMAPSILGYHKAGVCPQCGHEFRVNASMEAVPLPEMQRVAPGCVCPNCRYPIDFTALAPPPPLMSGDRILVARSPLERMTHTPQRFDLMLFKFPGRPMQRDDADLMYVKRLAGLSGETIAIHGGDLFVSNDFTYQDAALPDVELRARGGLHRDEERVASAFAEGKFRIVR
jgi:hypothetical protein